MHYLLLETSKPEGTADYMIMLYSYKMYVPKKKTRRINMNYGTPPASLLYHKTTRGVVPSIPCPGYQYAAGSSWSSRLLGIACRLTHPPSEYHVVDNLLNHL
jgi:hypothetical protein